MYSFCKRSKGNYDDSNSKLYEYSLNNIKTSEGFNKTPLLCPGLTQAFVQNRKFPSALIDFNSNFTGQNSQMNHCAGDSGEIQFSTLRPFYGLPKGPPLTIQVSQFGDSPNNELWIGQNLSRPTLGAPEAVTGNSGRKMRL